MLNQLLKEEEAVNNSTRVKRKRSNKTKPSAQEEMKMKTAIRLGDLIAALYAEAKKETKDKRMQSVLVGLAFHDLKLRYVISKKSTMIKKSSAA